MRLRSILLLANFTIDAGLGDKENAYSWLEKDFQNRTSTLVAWMSIVHFESMEDDPRMADLCRRMGLPSSSS